MLESPFGHLPKEDLNEEEVLEFSEKLLTRSIPERCLFLAYYDHEMVGCLTGFVTPVPYIRQQLVAKEDFWYVKPIDNKYRAQLHFGLMELFVEWAKVKKAYTVIMGSYTDRVAHIMRDRYEFRPFSIQLEKRL